MDNNENNFLAYSILKNKKEIKTIQQSDIPNDLIDRLSATWAVTGENYMTSLLVNYISEALDKLDDDESRDIAIRRAIQRMYFFLHDCEGSYEELEKEYAN